MAGHRAFEQEDEDWRGFAASQSTLVVYMHGFKYGEISRRLRSAGFAEDIPCAIISRATTPQQQIHRTTVSDLHRAPRLPAPTLLVVGEVVRFADPALVEGLSSVRVREPLLGAAFVETFTGSEESLP